MRRLRIAQVGQLFESLPPRHYGGTERVVSWLTEALVELGHDVTLFASGDSTTAAELVPVIPRAIRSDPEIRDWVAVYVRYLELVRQRAEDFDLIHFHIDALPFSLFTRQSTPFVTTLHGRLDLNEYRAAFGTFPTVPLVSISNFQRSPLPGMNWVRTVHHGMPQQLLAPPPDPSLQYLAFLGRISPEKGIEVAIRAAQLTHRPLRIAAKVDNVNLEYFKSKIEPHIDGQQITFIGEITDAEKSDFLGNAQALLFPIDWPESFGLTMIEAAACGTPVVALRRASVPEVIEDRVTGLISDTEAEFIQAIEPASRLDRTVIRSRFEARFTASRMARDYVEVYERLMVPASPHQAVT